MCVWAMQQGDEFYDQQLNESRYGGGVWNMIASVLKVGAAAPPHVADAGAGEGDPAQSARHRAAAGECGAGPGHCGPGTAPYEGHDEQHAGTAQGNCEDAHARPAGQVLALDAGRAEGAADEGLRVHGSQKTH